MGIRRGHNEKVLIDTFDTRSFTWFSTLAYSYESEININGGFERDQNGNSLPDFWETVWRNGTSAGSFASIQSFDPVEGSNHFRLYSGIGDSQSYVYALSDPIKIVKGVAYKINTSMRYTLPTGDARITIIEIDNSGKISMKPSVLFQMVAGNGTTMMYRFS